MFRACAFALAVLWSVSISACSRAPESTPATAKPHVSGIDASTFDRLVRPQDDVFKHVNGAWLAKTEIPADKSSYGAFDMLVDKSQADLRAIVEDAAKAANKTPGSDAQKIGDFYESFMNESRVEQLGLTPLEQEFASIAALNTKADLARYFGRMFKLNLINPVVGFVDGDAQQPDREILYVNQGGLGLPDRDYYLQNEAKLREYREKYVAFLGTLLKLANQTSPEAAARDIFSIETRLARAHWTNVESRDAVKTYNKRSLADLPKEFPGFDWTAWTTELGIAQAPAVVISQPSYVKAFAVAFSELAVDRWKPYLRASVLNGFAPYLSKAFADTEFGFTGRRCAASRKTRRDGSAR